jgi:hypothetical protein
MKSPAVNLSANCWFMAAHESQNMWDEFGKGNEGVVVKSTAGALVRSLATTHGKFWVGKVNYIDASTHDGPAKGRAGVVCADHAPHGEDIHIDEFKTEAEARAWIVDKSPVWLRKYRGGKYAQRPWRYRPCASPIGSDRVGALEFCSYATIPPAILAPRHSLNGFFLGLASCLI